MMEGTRRRRGMGCGREKGQINLVRWGSGDSIQSGENERALLASHHSLILFNKKKTLQEIEKPGRQVWNRYISRI